MTNTRIGKEGYLAHKGDIVEVFKGRKYPIGMRMVVADIVPVSDWWGRFMRNDIEFVGEGFEIEHIDAHHTKIIAQIEDRDENPMYGNVSSFHYDKWGNFVFDESIKEVE